MKLETLEEGINLRNELYSLQRIKNELDALNAGLPLVQNNGCYFLRNIPGLRIRFYNDVVAEIKIVKDKIAAL